jgi:hypothetical protein
VSGLLAAAFDLSATRGSLRENATPLLKRLILDQKFQSFKNFWELRLEFPGTDSEDKTTTRKGQPK